MKILTIRTDNHEAEIGLYNGQEQHAYKKWAAHRELSSSLHKKIQKLLEDYDKDWSDIEGVVLFSGPGSFTGLRIGATVANTTVEALSVPIVGANGERWISDGIDLLLGGKDHKLIIPFYGRDPHITTQKK